MEEYNYNNFKYQHDIQRGLIGITHPLHKPNSLFKFFPISRYSVQNLKDNLFYGPHFYELNDILDGSAFLWFTSKQFSLDRYKEQLVYFPEDMINQIYSDDSKPDRLGKAYLAHNWSNQTNRLGIISFTAKENNILMWPHYAQEEGFQLKINTDALDSYFLKNFDGVYLGMYPMNYVERLECFDLITTESDIIPMLYAATIKSQEWEYEKEWRVLLSRENMGVPYSKSGLNPRPDINIQPGNRLIKYDRNLIDEITVGANFINQTKFKFNREKVSGKISSQTSVEISDNYVNHEVLEDLLNYICENLSDRFYFPTTIVNTDLSNKKFLTRGKERINISKVSSRNYSIERTGEFIYFDTDGNRNK